MKRKIIPYNPTDEKLKQLSMGIIMTNHTNNYTTTIIEIPINNGINDLKVIKLKRRDNYNSFYYTIHKKNGHIFRSSLCPL